MLITQQETLTEVGVVLGVDMHLDVHVAVALDELGRRLGEVGIPANTRGYEALVEWAEEFGPIISAGVEGTSSYGAGLARYLSRVGIKVMEVERPKRHQGSSRRPGQNGKSDPLDAEAAARAVIAGDVAGEPKSGDGRVEMIRALRAARRSAVKARSQATNQLKSLLVTATDELRDRLRGLSTKDLVNTAIRFRPGALPQTPEEATRFALRSVARRYRSLSEEITELDAQLKRLVAEVSPVLPTLLGVGTDHSATLLVVAGDNPERLKSEASFANLCGVAPIEASSGKVVRHRLNRGGNRDANRALHLICVVRMRHDQRTKPSRSSSSPFFLMCVM